MTPATSVAVVFKMLLVKRMQGHIAWLCSQSVLTVQEVQSNHFYDFLQPELLKHGYSAVYKKKTMEIYTGNSYAIDGCATFFKKDKFGLVKKYEVCCARQLDPLQDKSL